MLIIVRTPCHNHTDTSTLIIICFIHHIPSNAIESLPRSWHNFTRTVDLIRYGGSIDCKTNVLFHEMSLAVGIVLGGWLETSWAVNRGNDCRYPARRARSSVDIDGLPNVACAKRIMDLSASSSGNYVQ